MRFENSKETCTKYWKQSSEKKGHDRRLSDKRHDFTNR